MTPAAAPRRVRARGRVLIAAVMVAAALLVAASSPVPGRAAVTSSTQPSGGPGGSATPFGGVRTILLGSGYNAYELLLPADPAPPSAPFVVVMHGYYEFAGYGGNGAIAAHVARQGNVVVYPRWQTNVATPCPGPFDIEPCITSAVGAVESAIAYLRAHPSEVQPRLDQTSYFGFSFGGIITADMLSRYRSLGLPRPRAVFLDDPHDGGLSGNTEPALGSSLSGIPPSARLVCHSGGDGVISQNNAAGLSLADASCNAVFPKIGQIPPSHKSLVLTSTDHHGTPGLSSGHGVCAGGSGSVFPIDTSDWGFCWRSFDALRACALFGADCAFALGDTPQNRFIGTWSDGVPLIGLKIASRAPIRALPTPPRQPPPPVGRSRQPPGAAVSPRPLAVSHRTRLTLSGTAAGANGVAFVQVAVVRRVHGRCAQLTTAGTFTPLARCAAPRSVLFAAGTSRWSLTLPGRLGHGSYRILVRAVDGFGQTPRSWTGRRLAVV